ncbi:MAG: phthiotriol/phenolphthiotriol dimycocerosates methyltransferase [Verrucomicrobiota bacterium]
MLDRLFAIGRVRETIWRLWYPYLTNRLREKNVFFLNYAFEETEYESPTLQLAAEDEANRACIQLYHHVASQIDLRGLRVLEVSCGHGGGASWIARTMNPECFTGLDLNPKGVAFCQEHHSLPNLSFIEGNAQELPFSDGSFDAVLNVEASHCYPDFAGFLTEVARVLRPEGHLLYADFRFSDGITEWERDVADSSLSQIQSRDISQEVLRGMDRNAKKSLDLVETCLPSFLHSLGKDFAGVPDSKVYDALKSGELSYRSWCLQKAPQ